MYVAPSHEPSRTITNFTKVVDEESAAPTLPDVERASIQADHSHMCKFESENSPGFDLIVDGIRRYSEDAPATINERWVSEKQDRQKRKFAKAKELYPGAIGESHFGQNLRHSLLINADGMRSREGGAASIASSYETSRSKTLYKA